MIKTRRDDQRYPEMTDKTDNIGDVDEAEKPKFLILEWIKADNIMNSIFSLSAWTLLRLSLVAVISMMYLGAIFRENASQRNTRKTPMLFNFSSYHQRFIPPES